MSDFGLSRSGRCVCVTFLSQYPISSFHQFYTLVFVPTTLQLCFPIVFPFHLPGSTFCLSISTIPFLLSLALSPLSLYLLSLPQVSWLQLSLHIPFLPRFHVSKSLLQSRITLTYC